MVAIRFLSSIPFKYSGSRILSRTDNSGSKLYDWKIKPVYFFRNAQILVLAEYKFVLFHTTWPLVGISNPASIWSNVDLPDPLFPIIKLVPGRNKIEAGRTASIHSSPCLNIFLQLIHDTCIPIPLFVGYWFVVPLPETTMPVPTIICCKYTRGYHEPPEGIVRFLLRLTPSAVK